MFLIEKYRPKEIHDFTFNHQIVSYLSTLACNNDIPHIIIAGPSGGGKKTLVNFMLNKIYGNSINNTKNVKYEIASSSSKKEIDIVESMNHIVIEPTGTNQDKYILQGVIKKYAHSSRRFESYFSDQDIRPFKTIIIYNVESLAINSQAALRRTMEKCASFCRFIMVCNNLSKVFDPLRSRCLTICVPLPSLIDIRKTLISMCIRENIDINNQNIENIIKSCNGKLKEAIWLLDIQRLDCDPKTKLASTYNRIVDLIMSCTTCDKVILLFENKIRPEIYNIMVTNINATHIITTILNKLIERIDDNLISQKIIVHACNAEYNMSAGRRDITHIDYFIANVMKELIDANT